ncbi:MAG: TonB family protein [Terriglobales bacterium]|jgi:protein TonB
MFHDDSHPENHLERASLARPGQAGLPPALPDVELQRKRMLIALGILVLALGAVILKDWDFWFPSKGETGEAAVRSRSKSTAQEVPGTTAPVVARERKPTKPIPAPSSPAVPFTATAERAVLPPLQVEVVAGNRHVTVPAKSNAIHVDVGAGAEASNMPPSTNARASGSDHVQLSPQTAQNVSVSVPPDYPLLARQMKVQGVVSLQALIARDGTIQELQILSGPEILATAAREAVKQWHFKPYLQNGHPVETQAKITVNFTISTN